MRFTNKFVVRPKKRLTLAARDADETLGFKEGARAESLTQKAIARLDELQNVLWAEKRRALLIVLQAMDAGGKDGTIRHVMSGVNPQGCRVTSFKRPTEIELNHDFLWRVHQAVPAKGEIGIFNRSHYEDVLVARVHKLVPEAIWSKRFDQINDFERLLKENQVTTLKFFLHISKDEQRKRLQKRLQDPAKQWKLQLADFKERKYWSAYIKAYEDVLIRCSTAEAPWFVIPANNKWFRNLAVSSIVAETLEAMKLRFPPPSFDLAAVTL
jgi:PPK2 family polyphosphate:nucleotide phosphotransferase